MMKLQGLHQFLCLASIFLLLRPCLTQYAGSNGTLSTAYPADPTGNGSISTNSSAVPLASGTRPVYLVMNVRLKAAQIFPPTYDKLFPAYAALHFNATAIDGPLEIQLINKDGQDVIRVTDWGLTNSDKPMGVPQPGYLIDYFEPFGKSNATNDDILNATTGEGLVHDVWARNASLSLKAWNSVDFMHACIEQLGLGLAPASNPTASAIIPTRIIQAQRYWRNLWVADRVAPQYPVWLETLQGWGASVQKTRAEFHFKVGVAASLAMVNARPVPTDPSNSTFDSSVDDDGLSDLAAPEMTETYYASNETTNSAPSMQWIYSQPAANTRFQRREQLVRVIVLNPGGDDDRVRMGFQLDGKGEPVRIEDPVRVEDPVRTVGDVVEPRDRIAGALNARIAGRTVSQLFRDLSIVGEAAGGIVIMILDFRNSKKDTGASVGCAAAVTFLNMIGISFLFLAPELPLGDFVMLAAMVIGEIPDMTHSVANYAANSDWKRDAPGGAPALPLRTDVAGILQYTIVGDQNKTGNENCINNGGFKQCTVVYGPYLLASALKMEAFDAFALLIHYNDGYPMSMADLIKAFTLSTSLGNENQVATIDCSQSPNTKHGKIWVDTDGNPVNAGASTHCAKAIFSLKRQLVTIPIGDCALVGDVSGGERYPAYNMTIKGGAVAIACGIVGAININDTAMSLNGTTPTNASLINPGGQASDGSSGGGFLAPPPAAPFQTTLNLTNSICLTEAGGNSLCLPNGTYSRQSGSLAFDSTQANALSLLPNSSIAITESSLAIGKVSSAHAPAPARQYVSHQVTYSTNQSATDTNFAGDMQNMVTFVKGNTFDVHVPTQPDAACFYTLPYGRGDVACFGPGGGDLPDALKGKVRSLKAFGRASVEVFANNYANKFAHIFDTYEDDLADISYDGTSSFADKAYAIWVYLEPKPLV